MDTVFALDPGWNWIPYVPQTAATVVSVMPSHTYAQNDVMKSQTAFSTYYASYGWFGSLYTLEPGVGYMLKVATGGQVNFASAS